MGRARRPIGLNKVFEINRPYEPKPPSSLTGNANKGGERHRVLNVTEPRRVYTALAPHELRKVLDGDRRRWPDPRKRDLGKPERRKRRRQVSPSPPATLVEAGFLRLIGLSRGQSEGAPGSVHSPAAGSYHTAKWLNAQVRPGRAKAGRLRREPRKVGDGESRLR
jgi:hypothetical protein